jgi:hypothetical protein
MITIVSAGKLILNDAGYFAANKIETILIIFETICLIGLMHYPVNHRIFEDRIQQDIM